MTLSERTWLLRLPWQDAAHPRERNVANSSLPFVSLFPCLLNRSEPLDQRNGVYRTFAVCSHASSLVSEKLA